MRASLLVATAVAAVLASTVSQAEEQFTAVLVGHAILPAATFIPVPEDAPETLARAAKYTTPDRKRADTVGSVPGMDGVRPTGLSMPSTGRRFRASPASRTWAMARSGRSPTTASARRPIRSTPR